MKPMEFFVLGELSVILLGAFWIYCSETNNVLNRWYNKNNEWIDFVGGLMAMILALSLFWIFLAVMST